MRSGEPLERTPRTIMTRPDNTRAASRRAEQSRARLEQLVGDRTRFTALRINPMAFAVGSESVSAALLTSWQARGWIVEVERDGKTRTYEVIE